MVVVRTQRRCRRMESKGEVWTGEVSGRSYAVGLVTSLCMPVRWVRSGGSEVAKGWSEVLFRVQDSS